MAAGDRGVEIGERTDTRNQRAPLGRFAILVLIVVALVLVLLVALRALALRRRLLNGARELQAAQTVLAGATSGGQAFRISTGDLQTADTHLTRAQHELVAARADLDSLSLPLAITRQLPLIGPSAATVPRVVDFASTATLGARQLVDGLRPLARERDTPTPGLPAAARYSAALSAGEPHFVTAQRDLQQAQSARASIDASQVLPVLRGSLAPLAAWDRQWPTVQADLNLLIQLPKVAHAVLGFDAPQSYAILGQNSAELRPDGGFLGTMGIVRVANGNITQQSYKSIYLYDPDNAGTTTPLPAAPQPLVDHLGIAAWHIQDATWSPDFPTSARDLRTFLAYDDNITVNGVIAFDSYAVQDLLHALGPVDVTLDGQTERFTADNWLLLTTQLIYLDPEHPNQTEGKGRILAPLLQTVLQRVNIASGDQLTALLQSLRTAIAERHVLFQFDDPIAQQFVYAYNADGSLRQPPGTTTIYPVEANLSYTKIGPFIRNSSTYEFWFDERGVCQRAQLTLDWQNTVTAAQIADPVNRITGDEWNAAEGRLVRTPGVYGFYERVYVPQGASLNNSSGGTEPISQTSDGDFTVFGTYLRIAAGGTTQLRLDLALPTRETQPGHFVLQVPKQPGTQDREVRILVHTLSQQAPRSNLALTADGARSYSYSGLLNRDLRLDLQFSR